MENAEAGSPSTIATIGKVILGAVAIGAEKLAAAIRSPVVEADSASEKQRRPAQTRRPKGRPMKRRAKRQIEPRGDL